MKTRKKKSTIGSILATLAVVTLMAASAGAAPIEFVIQPIGAKQSSFFASRTGLRTFNAGLNNASIVETGDPVPVNWPSHDVNGGNMWVSDGPSPEGTEWLMYDLGAEYVLSGLHQWNSNEAGLLGRGIKDLTIKFATSAAGYEAGDPAHADWGSGFSTQFAQAIGTSTYAGQTIELNSYRTARYVLFDTTTTWAETYNRTGLAEIRFIAIPEPSTLIPLGIAAVGLVLYRRLRRRA